MSEIDKDMAIDALRELREAVEKAGLVEADPWDSLKEVWTGPDVDPMRLAHVGADTIKAVRNAYVEGRIEQDLMLQALDVFKMALIGGLLL